MVYPWVVKKVDQMVALKAHQLVVLLAASTVALKGYLLVEKMVAWMAEWKVVQMGNCLVE